MSFSEIDFEEFTSLYPHAAQGNAEIFGEIEERFQKLVRRKSLRYF